MERLLTYIDKFSLCDTRRLPFRFRRQNDASDAFSPILCNNCISLEQIPKATTRRRKSSKLANDVGKFNEKEEDRSSCFDFDPP